MTYFSPTDLTMIRDALEVLNPDSVDECKQRDKLITLVQEAINEMPLKLPAIGHSLQSVARRAELPGSRLTAAIAKLEAKSREASQLFIERGRGHMRPFEIREARDHDPLAKRWCEINDALKLLVDEERRRIRHSGTLRRILSRRKVLARCVARHTASRYGG